MSTAGQERAAAANALIEKLAERWPRCFSINDLKAAAAARRQHVGAVL